MSIDKSHPQEAPREERGASSFVDDSQHIGDFYKRLGKHIQSEREKRRITQVDLANRASIDRSYLSGIESGKRQVSLYVVYKIAKVLDTTIDSLMGAGD